AACANTSTLLTHLTDLTLGCGFASVLRVSLAMDLTIIPLFAGRRVCFHIAMRPTPLGLAFALAIGASTFVAAEDADSLLANYFRRETDAIARRCLSDVQTLDDWKARR